MQITGRIKQALPSRSGTSKTGKSWYSQDFVIEEEGNRFNKSAVFTVFGEDKLRTFNIVVGSLYTVDFDIDAHEYQGRWYNKVTAFNVTALANQTDATTAPKQEQQTPSSAFLKPGANFPPPPIEVKQTTDDLPFNLRGVTA